LHVYTPFPFVRWLRCVYTRLRGCYVPPVTLRLRCLRLPVGYYVYGSFTFVIHVVCSHHVTFVRWLLDVDFTVTFGLLLHVVRYVYVYVGYVVVTVVTLDFVYRTFVYGITYVYVTVVLRLLFDLLYRYGYVTRYCTRLRWFVAVCCCLLPLRLVVHVGWLRLRLVDCWIYVLRLLLRYVLHCLPTRVGFCTLPLTFTVTLLIFTRLLRSCSYVWVTDPFTLRCYGCLRLRFTLRCYVYVTAFDFILRLRSFTICVTLHVRLLPFSFTFCCLHTRLLTFGYYGSGGLIYVVVCRFTHVYVVVVGYVTVVTFPHTRCGYGWLFYVTRLVTLLDTVYHTFCYVTRYVLLRFYVYAVTHVATTATLRLHRLLHVTTFDFVTFCCFTLRAHRWLPVVHTFTGLRAVTFTVYIVTFTPRYLPHHVRYGCTTFCLHVRLFPLLYVVRTFDFTFGFVRYVVTFTRCYVYGFDCVTLRFVVVVTFVDTHVTFTDLHLHTFTLYILRYVDFTFTHVVLVVVVVTTHVVVTFTFVVTAFVTLITVVTHVVVTLLRLRLR